MDRQADTGSGAEDSGVILPTFGKCTSSCIGAPGDPRSYNCLSFPT